MNCCEFRENYSDYADGVLGAREAEEARTHLVGCAACRRFDAAFRTGLNALRGLPQVGVSRGFGPRLRARLSREFTVRLPVVAHWSGALGTMLLVATVGVVALDLLGSQPARHETLPIGQVPASPGFAPAGRAPMPVVLAPSYDTIAVRIDAFHPLESVLVQPATGAAEPATVTAAGLSHYDYSVVWGGQ